MTNEIMSRPEFGLQNGTSAAASAPAITAQAREVARVQGEILMAKKFPRNEADALRRIEAACSRMTLAQSALYEYKRGGASVTGPSIRLAEQIARCYTNIRYGFEVLDADSDHSIVRAYSYDIEANVQAERTFSVPHEIGLKGGNKKILTDPRDIYECIANNASRRVRACILETIPGDIVDYAVELCNKTVKSKIRITPDALQKVVEAFGQYGITQAMIEAKIQSNLNAISTRKFVELKNIWTSIRDGIGKPEDYFDFTIQAQAATAAPAPDFSAPAAPAEDPAPQQAYTAPDDGLDDAPEDEEAFNDIPF